MDGWGMGGGVDGRVSALATSLRGLFCFYLFPPRWVPRLTSLRADSKVGYIYNQRLGPKNALWKKNSPGLI